MDHRVKPGGDESENAFFIAWAQRRAARTMTLIFPSANGGVVGEEL